MVYLAEEGELVIRQETIGLVHEKVPPNELLEAPVLSLDKPMKESSANDSHIPGPLIFLPRLPWEEAHSCLRRHISEL